MDPKFIRIVAAAVMAAVSLLASAQEVRIDEAREPNVDAAYDPKAFLHGICDNGDFESGLDPKQWEGAKGTVPPNGDPVLSTFVSGIESDSDIENAAGHQTLVSGADPIVPPLSTTAPYGLAGPPSVSTRAVRIGNAAVNSKSELLAKTFMVTPSNAVIKFWFAVVLQNPMPTPDNPHIAVHAYEEQPSFWVRVTNVKDPTTPLANVVDLGNPVEKDKVVADKDNLFFKSVVVDDVVVVYSEWRCAQIDLSKHIGETVTVEFITEDCTRGGHFGYAYIDNFCGSCGGSSAGDIGFNQAASSNCGRGKLCFDYTLPKSGATTGNVTITLDIVQNGSVVQTYSSGPQSTGTQYCFPIDPATITGLSSGPGYFDFAATAAFSIGGSSLGTLSAGTVPNGQNAVQNDDYKITCDTGCCPGPNLIVNGDFETGNTGFTSAFTNVANPSTAGAVQPGQYAVTTSGAAAVVSSSWNVQSHTACNTTGKFLVANGSTGLSGSKLVWSQTVAVVPGKEYRFCANFRNLPQCALDVKPNVEIRFSSPPNSTAPFVVATSSSSACDWLQESRSIAIPANTVLLTAEIWLDESAAGDGNDLAIDDISLQEMQKASNSLVQLNLASSNLTLTDYNMTVTPANGQPYSFYWEVCEVDNAGNCIAANQVSNPPQWWTPGANDF